METVRLCLVGYNRNLHDTVPSLLDCFSRSLSSTESLKVEEIVLVFSSRKSAIESTLFLASQVALRRGDREKLKTLVLEENDVDAQCYSIKRIAMKAGDPWPKTNFVSLHRSIHQLQLQALAFQEFSRPVDFTIFARADLAPPTEIALAKYKKHSEDFLLLPNWHRWGGHNDRFAIVPRKFEPDYFARIDKAEEFIRGFGQLHAETFLKYCLKDVPTLEILGEKFRRTRVGGMVKREFRYAEALSKRMVWMKISDSVRGFLKRQNVS